MNSLSTGEIKHFSFMASLQAQRENVFSLDISFSCSTYMWAGARVCLSIQAEVSLQLVFLPRLGKQVYHLQTVDSKGLLLKFFHPESQRLLKMSSLLIDLLLLNMTNECIVLLRVLRNTAQSVLITQLLLLSIHGQYYFIYTSVHFRFSGLF